VLDSLLTDHIGLRIEGCGPPIVLLHSSMSSKSQWRELIDDGLRSEDGWSFHLAERAASEEKAPATRV